MPNEMLQALAAGVQMLRQSMAARTQLIQQQAEWEAQVKMEERKLAAQKSAQDYREALLLLKQEELQVSQNREARLASDTKTESVGKQVREAEAVQKFSATQVGQRASATRQVLADQNETEQEHMSIAGMTDDVLSAERSRAARAIEAANSALSGLPPSGQQAQGITKERERSKRWLKILDYDFETRQMAKASVLGAPPEPRSAAGMDSTDPGKRRAAECVTTNRSAWKPMVLELKRLQSDTSFQSILAKENLVRQIRDMIPDRGLTLDDFNSLYGDEMVRQLDEDLNPKTE